MLINLKNLSVFSAALGASLFGLNIGITNAQVNFSSGSTITTDGEVYAPGELSPNQEREIKNLIASGEESGVVGTNLFVLVKNEIVIVPMAEIEGKKKEEIVEIFKSRVLEVLERNLEKNSKKTSKGSENALGNQQQAIEKVAEKAEKAAEKAEKAAEKAEKAAEKAEKNAKSVEKGKSGAKSKK